MSKKTFFSVTSILLIIISFFIIINVNSFVQLEFEALTNSNELSNNSLQGITSLFENGKMVKITIILTVLQILLNLFVFFQARKNTILKKKGLIIAINIYSLCTSTLIFVLFLSFLNIIVLICLKRKEPEDFPSKEKLPLPTFEDIPLSKKGIIFAIILCIIYFSQVFVSNLLPDNISDTSVLIISIVYYLVLFILGIICIITIFPKHIIAFFKNHKAYFQNVIGVVGIMYVAYYSLTILTFSLANVSTSINQSSIEELPIYLSALLAIAFAPIIEEIIFRGLLRKCIPNNTEFIIISAVIFGVLHIMYESNLIEALALSVPYTILGGFLAYIYVKTNNISNNILVHAFHNTVGVIFMLLLR